MRVSIKVMVMGESECVRVTVREMGESECACNSEVEDDLSKQQTHHPSTIRSRGLHSHTHYSSVVEDTTVRLSVTASTPNKRPPCRNMPHRSPRIFGWGCTVLIPKIVLARCT